MTQFARHRVASVDTGSERIILYVEVEGGRAWIGGCLHGPQMFFTSFDRNFYEPSGRLGCRWGRMDSDPRAEFPRFTTQSLEDLVRDMLSFCRKSLVAEGLREALATSEVHDAVVQALAEAVPIMDAAIVMDS